MNILKQNPFRVLGLIGNSSERELQKQIGIIKRYAEIGKSKTFDFDFDFIGELSRDIDDIHQAASSIEQSSKKLHYSLFWFVNNSPVDEIALNHLSQDTKKSIEIWKKALKTEITNKNFSSYHNFSTLALIYAFKKEQINIKNLQRAITIKGQLINSVDFKSFSTLVTGNGIANDITKISKDFVDEIIELLKPYLDKNNGITTNELISLFDSFPNTVQKYLSGKFTEVPLSNIENRIDKSTIRRKENPRDAEEYGEELFESTKSDIAILKRLMSGTNLQYQMIANKLANEILQCSIDFFNIHRDENEGFDPGDDALRIAKYAKFIVANGQAQERINENIKSIQDWVDDKSERDKNKLIQQDIEYILEQLRLFKETDYGRQAYLEEREAKRKIYFKENNIKIQPAAARRFPAEGNYLNDVSYKVNKLLTSCYPSLKNIHHTIGDKNALFLQLSSAVVHNSLELLVAAINKGQDIFSKSYWEYGNWFDLEFKGIIEYSIELFNIMLTLVIYEDLKIRLNENRNTIWKIADQLNVSTESRLQKKTKELQKAKTELTKLANEEYLQDYIDDAKNKLNEIKSWHMLRSSKERDKQIVEQLRVVNSRKLKSQKRKEKAIIEKKASIIKIEQELEKLETLNLSNN